MEQSTKPSAMICRVLQNILHPILFQFNDPGALKTRQRFEQECQILSRIKHPHIIQFLRTTQDTESGLPVLLMELMDESLTVVFQRCEEHLPYCTQVNLCHDVALALSYLHSNGIIHLATMCCYIIIAGSRAKVTDFGMSKLASTNPSMTPLTQCPGTLVYMSPEALEDPPTYSNKLDCFSFGVLGIQFMTLLFPEPGPRTLKAVDPKSPVGTYS